VATLIIIVLLAVFVIIVIGTIIQAIADIAMSILSWIIVIGLIAAGLAIGSMNPAGYVISVFGLFLCFTGGD